MLPSDQDSPSRLRLSALADGEAAESECAEVFRAWGEDADARATWHAYHLIGDVLRSEALAGPAGRSCQMLQGVRARLAAEPVVLAPARPARAAAAPRPRWQAPAAMAAGFLAVVVGVQVARTSSGGSQAVATAERASSPALVDPGRRLVRSVSPAPAPDQVMPYVNAHRLSTLDAVLVMPGQMPAADLHNASIVQPAAR